MVEVEATEGNFHIKIMLLHEEVINGLDFDGLGEGCARVLVESVQRDADGVAHGVSLVVG